MVDPFSKEKGTKQFEEVFSRPVNAGLEGFFFLDFKLI
jgi:hypothetical protein